VSDLQRLLSALEAISATNTAAAEAATSNSLRLVLALESISRSLETVLSLVLLNAGAKPVAIDAQLPPAEHGHLPASDIIDVQEDIPNDAMRSISAKPETTT
jgi:hypothetical protein